MLKYWYDTEFIEDGHTIDLVSIGIVAEDGRELYAQVAEADYSKASEWVSKNVLGQLLPCVKYPAFPHDPGTPDYHLGWSIHRGQIGKIDGKWVHCTEETCPWRKRYELQLDLLAFCDPAQYGKPEFWAYYADYDHVALCQLFGRMIDLPKGWPMYTRDIKQWCDMLGNPRLPKQEGYEHNALADARWNKQAWEFLENYKRSDFFD